VKRKGSQKTEARADEGWMILLWEAEEGRGEEYFVKADVKLSADACRECSRSSKS
jgi:hypothetical protein